MAKDRWTGPADIAWCDEHGLHGARNRCFDCDKPVEQIRMVPLEDLQSDEVFDAVARALAAKLGSDVALHPDLLSMFTEQAEAAIKGLVDHFEDFGPRGDEGEEGAKPADPPDGTGEGGTKSPSPPPGHVPDAEVQEGAESSRVGGPSTSIDLGRLLPPYGGIEHCANVGCVRDLDEDVGAYMYRDLESDKPLCVFCGDCARYVELNRPERFKLVVL